MVDEIRPLWDKHWDRLGVDRNLPLDPDIQRYLTLDKSGVLHVVTMRTGGELVGYFFSFVSPFDLHYRSLKRAYSDIYFIDPARVSGLSLVAKYRKLFKVVESELKALGVQKLQTAVKVHSDIGSVWERSGYKPVERSYTKDL